jgi:hypothetical protein
MGLKQADPKTNEHKFALLIVTQKGSANTNGVKGMEGAKGVHL